MAALLHQKCFHVVKRHLWVGSDDRQSQCTTLSYQEPVEGIPEMRWKVAHSEGVTVLDGKWIDPNRSHAVGDVRGSSGKSSLPSFDLMVISQELAAERMS